MAAETKMIVNLKVDLSNDKKKKRAMETIASITGIESINVDAEAQKLTVVCGLAADPVRVVTKLRRRCKASVISMEPPTEEPNNPPPDEFPKMLADVPYYNSYHNGPPYYSMYSNGPIPHLEYYR